MATKSKSDWALIWSILAIIIAVGSIVYCFPPVLEMVENGWERSTRTVTYIARLMRGGAV